MEEDSQHVQREFIVKVRDSTIERCISYVCDDILSDLVDDCARDRHRMPLLFFMYEDT
jgi:hypothetical protein